MRSFASGESGYAVLWIVESRALLSGALRPVPADLPFTRPFTLAEARSLGISRARIRGALERGEIKRVARGLFADAGTTTADVVRATCAVAEGRLMTSYVGAASVHGLLLPPEPHPSMTRPMRKREVPPEHLYQLEAVLLAGPAWAAANLARFQTLPSALVALDSALRAGVTRSELRHCAAHMVGWPGTAGLIDAVEHADALAESALESLARGQCINAALPIPQLQAEVVANRCRYRLDLLWPLQRVVLEVDGLIKYDDRQVMLDEKRRHNNLQAAGYTVLRCGFINLYPRADALIRQLRRLVTP